VFEDQSEEDWLGSIEAAASGNGVKAKRIHQWNEEWEEFCEWVVTEFGSFD